MRKPEPVLVIDLFPEERAQLLALLATLSAEEWEQPTVCPGWSVKDVGLHLLGDDVGLLSRNRDDFRTVAGNQIGGFDALVAYVNQQNARWLEATRRISPQVLCQLLRFTGDLTQHYFRTVDLLAATSTVSWVGREPVPAWLDVAREYTERWVHQQHIRDALDRPGFKEPRFFAPVLETFVWALPRAFQDASAPDGTKVGIAITGDAGGMWTLVREGGAWTLYHVCGQVPATQVTLDQELAWRLFTKGISSAEARQQIAVEGDVTLGMKVLAAVAIIA